MPILSPTLRELTKQLDAAARAAKTLDGELARVDFDPSDQKAVLAAIQQVEQAIDRKLARFQSNPLVQALAGELKSTYGNEIRRRAGAS